MLPIDGNITPQEHFERHDQINTESTEDNPQIPVGQVTQMAADKNIDKECFLLCNAVNSIEGLHTVESCCGHNKTHFHIWFKCDSLEELPELLYWLDPCHNGFAGWRCFVETDCTKSPVVFCIEGPVGAYDQANFIAESILSDMEEENKTSESSHSAGSVQAAAEKAES